MKVVKVLILKFSCKNSTNVGAKILFMFTAYSTCTCAGTNMQTCKMCPCGVHVCVCKIAVSELTGNHYVLHVFVDLFRLHLRYRKTFS